MHRAPRSASAPPRMMRASALNRADLCPADSDNLLMFQISLIFQSYCVEDALIVIKGAKGLEWIGAITLKWIGLLHIPTVALVCRDAYSAVQVPWRFARDQPQDGIVLRNNRCTLCGWMSGRKTAYPHHGDLCVECNNTGICVACSYVTADGRRLCGVCDLENDAPTRLKSIDRFLNNSGLYDALEYLQLMGNHSIEKMSEKRMPNTMRYIIIEWRRMAR